MVAYYNEIDPFAAAWLRELIKAGAIAPGDVDEKDMWDVVPDELGRYAQVHLCAGVGTWSHALRCAGIPDDYPLWTVSLPCQAFSAAGKGEGFADERGQLAEAFFWLAGVCRPRLILGEQVEAAIKHDWWDVMASQLEAIGYSVGAVGFPASACGAFHIRQRLYWVAYSGERTGKRDTGSVPTAQAQCRGEGEQYGNLPIGHSDGSPARGLADAEHADAQDPIGRGASGEDDRGRRPAQVGGPGATGLVGDTEDGGRRVERDAPQPGSGRHADGADTAGELGDTGKQGPQELRGRHDELPGSSSPGSAHFWSNAVWIPCRDGKWRPTQPGLFPLAHGAAARVGRLRGYGNAVVAPAAQAFIEAVIDTHKVAKYDCTITRRLG